MKTQPARTLLTLVALPIRSSRREGMLPKFGKWSPTAALRAAAASMWAKRRGCCGQPSSVSACCGSQTRDPVFGHHARKSATRLSECRQFAFTRAELLIILAVLALLTLVILPALANHRPRSHRVVCANNLREVGMAMQIWGSDHNDFAPFEVPLIDGGTRLHPLAPNTWLHFAWLSNELRTAQVLFCPTDVGKPAQDFTGDPATGYIHPNFANRATSYFLTHWFSEVPTAALAGDRNLQTGEGSGGCSRFRYVAIASVRPAPTFGWTSGLHETSGNLLRFDGRVEQLTSQGLRDAVFQATADNGRLHFVIPR